MHSLFRKVLLLLLFGLVSVQAAFAQKFSISGTIKEKKTGEVLIGASVVVVENKNTGCISNEYGFYSLTMEKGKYKILFRYMGFKDQAFEIDLNKNLTLNIDAESSEGKELNEVTVSAKNNNVKTAQMGLTKIDIKEIQAIPVLFGEKDVMKTIQLMPGVKAVGEGKSGFYVRGGASDQNLILLDEAIVYNPSHLLGFFSTFNSDAIKDLTLYKGTAPANYGGRLSSVMDVKMKEGNNQEYHVDGGIGIISSKLNIEGPIKKDQGSFLVSGRRTYADLLLSLSSDTLVKKTKLYFYDLNAKLNYKFGKKDRLYLSGYFGRDDLGLGSIFGINWGNATGTLRWNHIFSDKIFSNTSLILSDYTYNISINNSGINATIFSEIRDWNFKEEIEFFSNPKNTMRIGLSSIYHTITPGQINGTNITAYNQPDTRCLENAVYFANTWKPTVRLNIDYGLRLSSLSLMGGSNYYDLNTDGSIKDTLNYASGSIFKTYLNPEPRLSIGYVLTDESSIKCAYTRNSQYLHLISNSTTSNPTDKWVPSNNVIKPEVADLVSLGYIRTFKNDMYELNVETYYKNMLNQIDYKDNANVVNNDPIEPKLLFGQGRAYGLELFLRKNKGKFTGWISYTLSRTETQINGINNNKWYAARQDRTHDLAIVGIYQASKKVTLSATFVYYTGDAVTFPSGKYHVNNQVLFYYTERNGYRMPSYNRLDFGITKKLKDHGKFSSELSFSVYNAYGRQNPYIITFEDDPNNANKTQVVQTSLFRWVPSIAYNFKF